MEYKLIINCKNYTESTLNNFSKILTVCEKLMPKAKKLGVDIILCPSILDLKDASKSKVKIYAQHIDVKEIGAQTGYVVPQLIKDLGISGTLISHSEHILDLKEILKSIEIAKKFDLETCVCARDSSAAKKISKFGPQFIAVEPKELIGGDISISTAKPELITKSLRAISPLLSSPSILSPTLLVGAGVKNSKDVKKSIELGAKGILVASGVVKAKNIQKAIEELLDGFS